MSTSAPRLLGGRYEVGELIGRGGMAEVHLGHDARLGRPVAIKILRTDHARDAAFLIRFRREAQSVAGLNHPSIVAVYDSGEDKVDDLGGGSLDIPYIVMEYVSGRTLREVLNDSETGTLDPVAAARIVRQVLEALDYSHDMGIVHRDIKPGNVMVANDGSVKVMDFGIARAIADTQATMTQTQAVIGTAQYISPEQARGETVDKRSDVYSTGCLLFELLTARTPYTGEPISLTYQHVNAEIPLPSSVNPDVPPELDSIVVHALTKDRDDRYPDAKAMADDLAAFSAGMPISPAASDASTTVLAAAPRAEAPPARQDEPDTASLPAANQRRGSRMGWWIAALLLIPLALLGWFAWGSTQDEAVQVTMPRVIGSEESVAKADLEEKKLEVEVDTAASDEPRGVVIAQDPEEGTEVPEGDQVTITVSGGPDTVSVPNVIGMGRQEATQRLEEAGLKVGDITEKDSPDEDRNKVISTSPEDSESVEKGSTVDLVVASGDVKLKDFTGQDIEDVREQIYALNLEVSERSEESDQPAGTILEQQPGAGSIRQGRTVTFVVAKEKAPTTTVTPTPTEPTETTEPSDPTDTEPTSPTDSGTEDPTPTDTGTTRTTPPAGD